MGETLCRTVVVSAVSIRKGGTLTILRQCLQYLSEHSEGLRIVAVVHSRELFSFSNIEYIEMPECANHWLHRFKAEYFTMMKLSRSIAAEDGRKVWLWLSMHDFSPRVEAEHHEVYCHTSYPFMKVRLRDFRMDPKIPFIALLSKVAYRINSRCNDCIIVQQNWFADSLSKMLHYPRERVRVIPPQTAPSTVRPAPRKPYQAEAATDGREPFTFFYASTPDCHKNFETLCRASSLLQDEVGEGRFRTVLTISGKENRYSRWLYGRWGGCCSIEFRGYVSRDELFEAYRSVGCFVFPSRIESWGLPISEYLYERPDGPLLLADVAYAHEASSERGIYFPVENPVALKDLMLKTLQLCHRI